MKVFSPSTHSFRLNEFQGSLVVDTNLPAGQPFVFTVDIYTYLRQVHPETHLGWWAFSVPSGPKKIVVHCDFRTITRDSVRIILDGDRINGGDFWVNPAYLFDPLQDLQLVLRDAGQNIQQLEHVIMKID